MVGIVTLNVMARGLKDTNYVYLHSSSVIVLCHITHGDVGCLDFQWYGWVELNDYSAKPKSSDIG